MDSMCETAVQTDMVFGPDDPWRSLRPMIKLSKLPRIDPEAKRMVVLALRSGIYRQKAHCHLQDGDLYCVGGVVLSVMCAHKGLSTGSPEILGLHFQPLLDFLGLSVRDMDTFGEITRFLNLHYTFAEIADIIEDEC